MARKDNRGRNLKVGESQRKDGLYMYRYMDERTGKRVTIYDADLASLRQKERQIAREIDDGISTDRAVKKMTVNTLFERYMESKKLAGSTRSNYVAIWNNRVRDEIGMLKVVQVRTSHIKLFYSKLTKDGYSRSTIKLIHNLLYPSFEMAVDDDIIRKNPAKDTLGDNGARAKEKMALTPLRRFPFITWFFVVRLSAAVHFGIRAFRLVQIMREVGFGGGHNFFTKELALTS